ncbi:recombinase family protein [Bacillus sp. REN3]|uniref:recombinase family protein n=1 Tax=Bacillus sp. REN3 TaxID=2802440 RepID=UPI001AEE74D8|nr:recombinase family protein [Bacillus sp. REN3]
MSNDYITASYTRVSTLKASQKDSPEHQRMLCKEKAMVEGLQLDYEYEDRSSGTSIINRDDIQNMIKDAEKGFFKTIIFSSLSRFSRDTLDSLSLKRILVDKLNVRLISIEEGYDSKFDKDELKFQILSAVNQKLSEQISISSRRGIRQSAKKGNFTGSHAPYGYRKENNEKIKTLKIVEKDANIVKLIFDLYCNNNMGEKAITIFLNEKDIPSPKGEIWGVTTIQRILQNEAYTGRNVYNKYEIKNVYNDINNLQDRSKKLVQREKEKWERNEGKNWEPIVDDEVFNKAQILRLKRGGGKRGGIRNNKVNPFAGILKCAHCGSNFVSMKSGNKGNEYRYLICSTRRRKGSKGCENKTWLPLTDFRNDVLKNIIQKLSKVIDSNKRSNSLEIIEEPKYSHINEKKKKEIENKINQTRKLLFEARRDYKLGEIDQEQYEFDKKEFEKELEECKFKLANLTNNVDTHIKQEVFQLEVKKALINLTNMDFKDTGKLQEVLRGVIYEILVDKDGNSEVFFPVGFLSD